MHTSTFSDSELQIVREIPGFLGGPSIPVYNFPVSPKEAYKALYERKAVWQITGLEQVMFSPRVNPDNVARAFVFEADMMMPSDGGGKDMFGVEWEYVPQAGGSMVRPGNPLLADANEWYDKVVWPDPAQWDWASSSKANAGYLGSSSFNICWHLNGWYERLISFMDFEGAVVAMIDEDQKDAVKALFERITDLYIDIFGKYIEYFPTVDGFCVHDDWGSQKETFFSPETVAEMLVPPMKRFVEFVHSKGKYLDFHSCGQLFKQIPNMIDIGWDSWSGQPMNDTQKIYECYGDKILIGVIPDIFNPSDTSEEAQREAAKAYVAKFCSPDKPSLFNYYGSGVMTRPFREELYKQSRLLYNR